jgi:hypothetical protein
VTIRFRARHLLVPAMLAGAILLAPAAHASTVHYWADDVAGTGRFGPPVTGTAQAQIMTLAARYAADPAEFAQVAAFARFSLPGGAAWLAAHPAQWRGAVTRFERRMLATAREVVTWTSPYRTEFAVPHGTAPTTFGWTAMPDLSRTVLVFTWGDLVMNCGGQPYIPARRIPLPSRPGACKPATGSGWVPACQPCPAGTKLFRVPGIGAMCLCPQTVRVVVTTTTTVTTVTTVTVTYGLCPPPSASSPCPGSQGQARMAR